MAETGGEAGRISRRSFLTELGAFVVLGATGMGTWKGLDSLLAPRVASYGNPAQENGQASDDTESPFTIFWITDTQYLAERNPELYNSVTGWIVQNWQAFNGKLVIHTGDLVQDGGVLQEWVRANNAMKILSANNIPYLWCAGNHDDLMINDPTYGWAGAQFDSFNPANVSELVNSLGYTRWVGDCRDGMNTAVAFAANGYNFLVVNIEWNAPPEALDWFEGLLDDSQFQDYHVIVAPHAYEDAFGSTDDQRWGPTLEKFRERLTEIMDEHESNVFLTLNGHFATDSGYHTPSPICRRNQLMFDRQESTDDPKDPIDPDVNDGLKVGGATITLLTFDTKQNIVNVKTFDPYCGAYRTGDMDDYSFTLFPQSEAQGTSSGQVPVVPQIPAG